MRTMALYPVAASVFRNGAPALPADRSDAFGLWLIDPKENGN